MVPSAFIEQVHKIARGLDGLDYFQVLRIERDAPFEAIREAYHKQSRLFHPDRYHHLGMPDLIADLTAVSKRISEAYVTLRDDQKRQRYRKDIEGPERQKKLRYSAESEQEQRDEKATAAGQTAQGRQLFHQASAAWARGDKEGAVKSLKMALVYEPNNEGLKQKLAEWSA